MRHSVPVFLSLVSLACSSSSPAPAPDRNVQFALKYTTAAGQETHWCEYKKLPKSASGEVLVSGAKWSWKNAHHWAIYRLQPGTPIADLPLDKPFDCFNPLGAMKYAQFSSAFLQAEPSGETSFPAGTAFPFASDEIVILQTHAINTTAAPIDISVDLQLKVSDAAAVQNKLGLIQFYDPYIYVPAHAAATAQMRCKIPQDITLVRTTTHFHMRGARVDSFLDASDGTRATSPFVSSTSWALPPVLDAPVKVPQGSYIRTVCQYQGDDSNPAVQGQYKGDKEMCMTIAYYYPVVEGPAQGLFENCVQNPLTTPDGKELAGFGDSFGTGSVGCFDTLSCVQKVLGANPSEAPNPHDGQIDVGPNFQKCIVDSCPSASTPLFRATNCIGTKCAQDCSDPQKCQSCVIANCGAEVGVCMAQKCE